jgi:hypothetical protein
MRGNWQILVFMAALLAVAAPLFAVFDPTPDEVKQNREKLHKWREADRKNGDHKNYTRLSRDLRAFLALSKKRRDQLRRIDHELYQLDPTTQARLLNVLERYAEWLERLSTEQRKDIKQMPNRDDRMHLVRYIKEQQWEARLPASERARLQKAQGKERKQLRARLKERDRQRRKEWARAFKRWDALKEMKPFRLENSPPGLKIFINEYLRPQLNEQEKKHLQQVADKPILFPITLVEMADRHPMALPGPQGPARFEDLPEKIRKFLPELKDQKEIEGKWPDYGKKVAAKLQEKKRKSKKKTNQLRLPVDFMPASFEDLSHPMKKFVRFKLLRAKLLDRKEKARLRNAKGWPAYAETINALARKYQLRVPWQTLPGPQERWDIYRAKPIVPSKALPNVPRQTLRNFALLELTKKEREQLGLGPDRKSWERLKRMYFKRKGQKELEHWREVEKRKKKTKKTNEGKKK